MSYEIVYMETVSKVSNKNWS